MGTVDKLGGLWNWHLGQTTIFAEVGQESFRARYQVERAGDDVGKVEKDSDAATEFRTQSSADHEVSSTTLRSYEVRIRKLHRFVDVVVKRSSFFLR